MGRRRSWWIVVLAAAVSAASSTAAPDLSKAKGAGAPVSVAARITGLTILPSAPQPDEAVRVRVDGIGTCKVWFAIRQLEGSKVPFSLPPSWNPMGAFNELTRPPDATLALPGELPSLKLGAGRYKIFADSHEGFKGSNCKDSAALEFVVAEKAPVVLAKPGAGAPGAAAGTSAQGGPASLPAAAQGQAKVGVTPSTGATGSASSLALHVINGLTITPASPKPGDTVHVKVDGAGTCRVWFGIQQLDGPKYPMPDSGWNPMGVIYELTRPPDATLALPGELPTLKLGAGRWKISVDSHDPFKGATCKGSASLEFRVADSAPILIQGNPRPPR